MILFDARNLSFQNRVQAGGAVKELVARDLAPGDRVCLMVDDDELRILVPFTTRKESLISYLDSPEGLTSKARDIERRLKDLRESAESCRDSPDLVQCARQSVSSFLLETSRETEKSLSHLDTLLRGLAAIPDRKIIFYISDGLLLDPGDVAQAAVEHAIGQINYSVSEMRSFLARDYSFRIDRIYQLATEARAGFYPINGSRRALDEAFSPERAQGYGPENLPQARTDPFETVWQQVFKLHTEMARATGGVPVFKRDPRGSLGEQLRASAGVYTLYYYPPDASDRRKIKIKISRRGAEALYLETRRTAPEQQPLELPGEILVDEASYDELSRIIRVRLKATGRLFAVAPDSDPPTSFASLFFELRDAANRPITDNYKVISFPRGEKGKIVSGDLEFPFELRAPPGSYLLRADVRDLNGPARGSFVRAFSLKSRGAAPSGAAAGAGRDR